MLIDGIDIIKEANEFASIMLREAIKDKPLSIDLYKLLKSPAVLSSEYGKRIVDNIVLGAIAAYHAQLREKLLELGIDIGEMTFNGSPAE